MLIASRQGTRRKHRSSVAVQLLLSNGMTYYIVVFAVIGTDYAENTIPLFLCTGRCLVKAGCFVLSEHATLVYSGTSVYVRFGISPTWHTSCLDAKNFAWYTTFVWNTTRVLGFV
jgi:hypothetical protein